MPTYISSSGKMLILEEGKAFYKEFSNSDAIQLVLTRAKYFPPGNHYMTTQGGERIASTSGIATYKDETYVLTRAV